MTRFLTIAVVAFLAAPAARAQALDQTDYSTTLGTTAQNCVPADQSRRTLYIENPSNNTNNVCYSFGTPVCGAAGTSVLTPGNADFWSLNSAPRSAINCIASGASTAVTIRSMK